MSRLIIVALLVFGFTLHATANDAQPYFESPTTGQISLVNFERDLACQWGLPTDRPALQRSGACGLPHQANDLIIITHNSDCAGDECPANAGSVSGIALLRYGDAILLFDGQTLWRGKVISSLYVQGQVIKPQDEFKCAAPACGTAVTSCGERLADGMFGYCIVRFALRAIK